MAINRAAVPVQLLSWCHTSIQLLLLLVFVKAKGRKYHFMKWLIKFWKLSCASQTLAKRRHPLAKSWRILVNQMMEWGAGH